MAHFPRVSHTSNKCAVTLKGKSGIIEGVTFEGEWSVGGWRKQSPLFPTQKILAHITHGIVQSIARITRCEAEFATGFGVG